MKNVLVINYGFGKNEIYNVICKTLVEILTHEGVETCFVNDGDVRLIRKYDVIIFPSIKLMPYAKWAKKVFPEKIVIIWTHDVDAYEKTEGIILMRKGDRRDLKALVEKIKLICSE